MKRTPDQINNLRRALVHMYGPIMKFTTDEQLDGFADGLQDKINKEYDAEIDWVVRVRLKGMEQKIEDIKPEPTCPKGTVFLITKACKALLMKYPGIISISVANQKDPSEVYTFDNF